MADKPEERARAEIDRLLAAAGWSVQSTSEANIHAARGVAIREFPLKAGHGLAGCLLSTHPQSCLHSTRNTPSSTMNPIEQQFLNDLDKTPVDDGQQAVAYARRARSTSTSSSASSSSNTCRTRSRNAARSCRSGFRDQKNDYYLGEEAGLIEHELEARDYYMEKNVFWVPPLARWDFLQDSAKLAGRHRHQGAERQDHPLQAHLHRQAALMMRSTPSRRKTPELKGVLDKAYTQLQIDPANLSSLIDLIATIPFEHADLHAKDILGHVYEYFLGQFAIAEGKKGGQYYTPRAIVTLIVEMLEPYQGRVYDPCCGSGGFFVQIGEVHRGARRQARRDLRLRAGIQPHHLAPGRDEHGHPRHRLQLRQGTGQHLHQRPAPRPARRFRHGQSAVQHQRLVERQAEDDPRWKYGTPPQGNANFAWLQHMLHHLAPNGSMALLLANGSMSSNTNGEGDIRRALVEADLVECMVALPGQLFTNTQIPACIWFLTRNKRPHAKSATRDRKGETLFIDARKLGYMNDRVLRDFTAEDIAQDRGHLPRLEEGRGLCRTWPASASPPS